LTSDCVPRASILKIAHAVGIEHSDVARFLELNETAEGIADKLAE